MCDRPSFVAKEIEADGQFFKGNEPDGMCYQFAILVKPCACAENYVARVWGGNTWVKAEPI